MCVIVFKPVGKEMPGREILEACSKRNSDGMGFMMPEGGKVVGRKFLKLEEMVVELEKVGKEKPVVLHFRLATHGGKEQADCHPFPFPFGKRADLFLTSWMGQMGVMHNGVLSGYGERVSYGGEVWDSEARRYVPRGKGEKPLSDTQEFLCYMMVEKALRKRLLNWDTATLKLLEMATLDKWALMNGNGKVRRLGVWEEREGIWYSNTFWVGALKKEMVAVERWSGGRFAGEDANWALEKGMWVKRDAQGRKSAECGLDGRYREFEGREEWEAAGMYGMGG